MTNAYDFFPHGDNRHYWYGNEKQELGTCNARGRAERGKEGKGSMKNRRSLCASLFNVRDVEDETLWRAIYREKSRSLSSTF